MLIGIAHSTALAAPSAEDAFKTGGSDYATGALVGQGPAAVGYTGNWLAVYSDAQSPSIIVTGLNYSDGTNPMITAGGAAELAGNGSGRAGRLLSPAYGNASTGAVYFSVLIQLDAVATSYRGFELHGGGFDDGGNRRLQIVTGEPGVGATDSSFILRLFNNAGFAVDLGEGDTNVNLFVCRIDFSTSPSSDSITIWRNPENLKSEASSTPKGTLSGFDLQFDRTSLARFGGNGIVFDEVRFGSSWSDVTTVIDPADTDNDMMLDVYEMNNELTVGINDAGDDFDSDGSLNLEEHDRNTRANIFDTDGDGIRDDWERGIAFTSPMSTGTNPLLFDTDQDGIRDGYETNSRVPETPPLVGTSPLIADTDNDMESDGVELREGTDPLNGAESSASLERVIIDGKRDSLYPAALAVQSVETGFGDNANEWNAAYAYIKDDTLSLMFTGNLEDNFNKLEIFIDSTSGGSTTFTSAGNDNSANMNGMIFDSGFAPDYHLIARRGGAQFDLDIVDLNAPTFDFYGNLFSGSGTGIGTSGTGTVNQTGIRLAYDSSNTGGIGGTGGNAANQAAALSVTTGFEFRIALADIGNPGGDIRIMLLQNNSDHNFLSNQSLAGLPVGTGNLANPLSIDFNNFDGDQFFTISNGVPAPFVIATADLDLDLEQIQLNVTGLIFNQPYHVQKSTDLTNWSFIPGSNFTADNVTRIITLPAIPGETPALDYRISSGVGMLP